MKKIFLLFVILTSGVTSQSFASDSLEHFMTKDGRHMCSVFMENDFKLCSEFGIVYDGDTVVSGEKPFFSTGYVSIKTIRIGDEVFCVDGSDGRGGLEVDGRKCHTVGNSTPVKITGENVSTDTEVIKSTCTLNGKSVDCAEMAETAGSWLKMGLYGFLILGVLFLVGGIFWLMMLIHALSNPIPNKIMWVAVIFFISLIGAIIYYFVIKRKCTVVYAQPGVVQTMQNSTIVQTSTPVYVTPVPPIVTPTVVSPSIPVVTTMSVPVAPTLDGVPSSSTSL